MPAPETRPIEQPAPAAEAGLAGQDLPVGKRKPHRINMFLTARSLGSAPGAGRSSADRDPPLRSGAGATLKVD
jgi:hypothetical protein